MSTDTTDTKGAIGHNGRWRRVERARARLDANAGRIMQAMIDRALAGDVKAGKWLLEHTATTGPDGSELRPIARSVDMPSAADWGENGREETPRIVIGVSLGTDFAQLATPEQPRQVGAGTTPRATLPAGRNPANVSQSATDDTDRQG